MLSGSMFSKGLVCTFARSIYVQISFNENSSGANGKMEQASGFALKTYTNILAPKKWCLWKKLMVFPLRLLFALYSKSDAVGGGTHDENHTLRNTGN